MTEGIICCGHLLTSSVVCATCFPAADDDGVLQFFVFFCYLRL